MKIIVLAAVFFVPAVILVPMTAMATGLPGGSQKASEAIRDLNIRTCAIRATRLTVTAFGEAMKMSPAEVAKAARATGSERAALEEKANRAMVEMSDLFAQIMHGLVVQRDEDEHRVIRLCMGSGKRNVQTEREPTSMEGEAEALAKFCAAIPQSVLCRKL